MRFDSERFGCQLFIHMKMKENYCSSATGPYSRVFRQHCKSIVIVMNNNRPLVSVVIAAYNAAAYVAQALDSVFAQDYSAVEIIVVDDGSTDRTSEVIASYRSSSLKVIRQRNSGRPSIPRNVGIRNSSGGLVFIFDADDVMLPGKIRTAVDLWRRSPEAGLIFTNFETIDAAGSVLKRSFLDDYSIFRSAPRTPLGDRGYLLRAADAYAALLHGNYVGTSSVAIPRAVLDKVGLFDESIRVSEDIDLWFRITREYDVAFLDEVCHRYRVHGQSVMSSGNIANGRDIIAVRRRQIALGLPADQKDVLRRYIAGIYGSMAYEWQRRGEASEARANYRAAMRESFSWPLLRGWLGSFGMIRSMRTAFRSLTG